MSVSRSFRLAAIQLAVQADKSINLGNSFENMDNDVIVVSVNFDHKGGKTWSLFDSRLFGQKILPLLVDFIKCRTINMADLT